MVTCKIAKNSKAIFSDDNGIWNDVSFQVRLLSENQLVLVLIIYELASTGITLNNYYVNPVCSTRASIMSGRSINLIIIFLTIFPMVTNRLFRAKLVFYTLFPELIIEKSVKILTYMVGKFFFLFFLVSTASTSFPTTSSTNSSSFLLGASDYFL